MAYEKDVSNPVVSKGTKKLREDFKVMAQRSKYNQLLLIALTSGPISVTSTNAQYNFSGNLSSMAKN